MPTAIAHAPPFTVPGSSTSTALVRWNGTGGNQIQDSTILVGATTMGLAADTDLITFGNATLAITGAVTGVTSLQVDNLNINGNTISSTAGTDLLITPLGGQQIILDGTIIIDAGVVTGATSITSTQFVGGGVGLTALNGTQITSGTVPVAQLGSSGSRSSSTFLNGANAWAAAGVTDISCRVYSSAAQNIPQNSDETITWNQENYDTDTMHDNSTNNSRITATTAGKYLIVCNIEWAAGITGWRNHYLIVNGSTTIGSTRIMALDASKPVYNLVTIWDFSATDYVELRVHQNAGAARTVNNGAGVTFLAMHKIN